MRRVGLLVFQVFLFATAAPAVELKPTFEGTWSDEYKNAFLYAADMWEGCLAGDMQIAVRVRFAALPGSVGAQAGPTAARFRNVPWGQQLVPIALHGFLTGDHSGATQAEANVDDPNDKDFHISIAYDTDIQNEGITYTRPWYLGIEGKPMYRASTGDNGNIMMIAETDFITTTLHELAHGLGFLSYMHSDGRFVANTPSIFVSELGFNDFDFLDPFLWLNQASRAVFMAGGGCDWVFWVGWDTYHLRAGLLNSPASCIWSGYPSLYTPLLWVGGSSMSHLDRGLEQITFLSPTGYPGSETIYRTIAFEHLAMKDLGWEVCPSTVPGSTSRTFISGLGASTGDEQSDVIFIQNNSDFTQTLVEVRLLGANTADFALTLPSSMPTTIPPYGSVKMPVVFVPQAAGVKHCTVEMSMITDDYSVRNVALVGYASTVDDDFDALPDDDEVADLDPTLPGVQNPFDPDSRDTTGSDGLVQSDGMPDGRNDWDGDGISNRDEFASGMDVLDPDAMQTVEFSNTGNWPLRIDNCEIIGQHAADYRLASGDALNIVDPGSTHGIQVVFQPSATGTRTATLRVHYHDAVESGVADIPLSGNGV